MAIHTISTENNGDVHVEMRGEGIDAHVEIWADSDPIILTPNQAELLADAIDIVRRGL